MNVRPASPTVAVVGDGPAGAALASACAERGLVVVLHGTGEPWPATYASWRDEVAHLPATVFATVTERVVVFGDRRHQIDRAYAVFDNDALRAHLVADVTEKRGRVDPAALDADVVVDATGAGPDPSSWQTAFGVVLTELPTGVGEPGAVTLMDWRPATAALEPGAAPPSFCYVVPVPGGWLVEETVLAASPAVEPSRLRARLVERLARAGHDAEAVIGTASHVEEVGIPMGGRISRGSGAVVPYGAAAGFIHPATGYSVAASIRAAPRVAAAIASGGDVSHAVWPRPHRRARVLHDYGLDALLRLDQSATTTFFDAFFELPVDQWSAYLRIDTTPSAVATVMRRVFRSAPWPVRRRLMAGNPAVLWRLLVASRPIGAPPTPTRPPRRRRR